MVFSFIFKNGRLLLIKLNNPLNMLYFSLHARQYCCLYKIIIYTNHGNMYSPNWARAGPEKRDIVFSFRQRYSGNNYCTNRVPDNPHKGIDQIPHPYHQFTPLKNGTWENQVRFIFPDVETVIPGLTVDRKKILSWKFFSLHAGITPLDSLLTGIFQNGLS